MVTMNRASRRDNAGFTYIGLLLAIALMGAGLAAIGQSWRSNVQRSKEAELFFVGEQFANAIKRYYDDSPGGDKRLPKSLADLVQDKRYPVTKRHLRKIYLDPMRGKAEWGLVMLKDGIVGVHSLSEEMPYRNRDADAGTGGKQRYADVKFVADIPFAPEPVAATNTPNAPVPAPPPQIAEPVSPPPPVAPPVAEAPPTPPRPKPLPTDRCERVRELDARTCASSAARIGSPDSACEASAASRYTNCLAGVPIGPLSIRQ
jgi:type II secretory pathway pseudopilin PulG